MSARDPELAVEPSWGRRLAGVEGIRGLAALLVVAHHATRYLTDGHSAVGGIFSLTEMAQHGLTIFFVLSGFLLYRPFAHAVIRQGKPPTFGAYFRNRALRILPAYVVIFLLANFVLQSVLTENAITTGLATGQVPVGMITDPATFFANLFVVQSFSANTIMTGIGPAWSLGAEILFYAALPALYLLGAWLASRGWNPVRAALAPVALMIIIGVATSAIVTWLVSGMSSPVEQLQALWGATWTAVLARSFLAQAALFGLGMGIAALAVWLQKQGIERISAWLRYPVLCVSLVVALLGAKFGGLFDTAIVGLAASAIVLMVILPGRTEASMSGPAKVLEWLPFRYLGLISYSVYLWHEPVAWWVRAHVPHDSTSVRGWAISLLIVIVVSVALSSLTYFGVERPALKLKRRTDRGRTTTLAQPSTGAVADG